MVFTEYLSCMPGNVPSIPHTVKTVTLDITKSLIIAPETLGASAGTWIEP